MTTSFEFIESLMGIIEEPVIEKFEPRFLEQVVEGRMAETGITQPGEYRELLFSSGNEKHAFRQALFVGYSEFFRNPITYGVLSKIILPGLLEKTRHHEQREIRVWSAAAAGGQEAYSIAIVLHELMKTINENISIRIFATDINPSMLRQAEIGRYEANNLQQVPFRYIDRYFTFSHGMYEVAPEIKQFVFFSEFDLLSPDQYCPPACIYGDFDLVFCCNVLFYYNEKTRKLLLGKLSRCLHPQGYLVTSETERALIPHRNFSETYPPSAIFLKKN